MAQLARPAPTGRRVSASLPRGGSCGGDATRQAANGPDSSPDSSATRFKVLALASSHPGAAGARKAPPKSAIVRASARADACACAVILRGGAGGPVLPTADMEVGTESSGTIGVGGSTGGAVSVDEVTLASGETAGKASVAHGGTVKRGGSVSAGAGGAAAASVSTSSGG